MRHILALLTFSIAASAQVVTAVQDAGAYTDNLAQGTVFVVKGTNIISAAGFLQANAPIYPTVLNNVSLTMTAISGGAVVTPLMVYTYNIGGVNQIAAYLPSTAAIGAYDLRVTNGSSTSPPFRTNVQARKPGIVTVSGDGSGPAQATINGDFILQRTSNMGMLGLFATRPAHPGERVDLWGTGLGADTASDTGGTSGDQTAAGQIVVLVNGVAVTPTYAGRSFGYPGLDQTVFNLPANVTLSCTVNIQIRAGGVLSNLVTIAVATGDTCTTPGGGGGGGSLSPSQSEIDSWTGGGAFSFGFITLGRSTDHKVTDSFLGGAPTTTTETSADFSATFGRASGSNFSQELLAYLNPAVGQCTVRTTIPTSPFSNLTLTSYDAGPSISASGPAGTQAANRSSVSGFISYDAGELPISFVAPGRFTLSGPGGANVGAFNGTLDIGADLNWTNWEEAKIITRSNGFTVRWTGGDTSQYVTISGTQSSLTGSFASFTCLANRSAGEFMIPSNILTQMPASPNLGAGGINILTRGRLSISAGSNGTRISAPGVDYTTANDDSSTSVTSEYR